MSAVPKYHCARKYNMAQTEYYRIRGTDTQVYVADAKRWPRDAEPHSMVYRRRDGRALWGVGLEELITEQEWLEARKQKT